MSELRKYFKGWGVINSWKDLPVIKPGTAQQNTFMPIELDKSTLATIEAFEGLYKIMVGEWFHTELDPFKQIREIKKEISH